MSSFLQGEAATDATIHPDLKALGTGPTTDRPRPTYTQTHRPQLLALTSNSPNRTEHISVKLASMRSAPMKDPSPSGVVRWTELLQQV